MASSLPQFVQQGRFPHLPRPQQDDHFLPPERRKDGWYYSSMYHSRIFGKDTAFLHSNRKFTCNFSVTTEKCYIFLVVTTEKFNLHLAVATAKINLPFASQIAFLHVILRFHSQNITPFHDLSSIPVPFILPQVPAQTKAANQHLQHLSEKHPSPLPTVKNYPYLCKEPELKTKRMAKPTITSINI